MGIYNRYRDLRTWADSAADLLELLLERDKARLAVADFEDDKFAIQQWVDRIQKQVTPRPAPTADGWSFHK